MTGQDWPGDMEQREAEDNMQQWSRLRLGADGEPCTEEQLKQAIRSSDVPARLAVKRCFREVCTGRAQRSGGRAGRRRGAGVLPTVAVRKLRA